jgi:hypothetical protein
MAKLPKLWPQLKAEVWNSITGEEKLRHFLSHFSREISGDIHDKFCQGENGDFP